MLSSRLIIDMPYDQQKFVTGYADKLKYEADQYLHLDLIGASTNIISIIRAYAQSYTQSNIKTVLDCRDYFIARALINTLRTTLFTDVTRQSLTAHTSKSISAVTTKAVYPSSIRDKDQVLGDSFGSLAYYFLFVKPEGYPSQYLNKLLSYVWSLLGINYTQLPKDRIKKLFRLLGKTDSIDSLAGTAIKQVLAATPGSDLYAALIQLRRGFITLGDVNSFSLRILTGKYSEALYPLFAAALSEAEYNKLAVYRSNIISVLRPAGFNLLLNSFIVEGYLKAADYISGLPDTLTAMSLDDFLDNKDLKQTHSGVIASHLATAYDALDFIQTYNLYSNIGEEAFNLLAFIYSWTPPAVYAKDDTRLYTLFDTIDIDRNTQQVFTNNLLTELSQLQPIGAEYLEVKASGNGSRLNITASNFTTTQAPIIIFVLSDTTAAPQVVSSTTTEGNNTTAKTLIVDVNSNQSIAAFAATNTRLQDGDTVSLTTLTSMRSDDYPTVSTSNVQIIEGTIIPDGIATEVNELITEQAQRYYNYNYITASSRPRGSVAGRYEAQGVTPDVLDTAQIKNSFGYRQEGYLDEYAGRMAGLAQQQKEVHINSELQVLKSWANSIKQITGAV